MSTETQVTPSDSTVPAIPTEPTVTAYQQIADNFLKGLEALVASTLPDLTAEHPTTAKFVRGHQNVSTDFLAATVAAVEQTPILQQTQKLDPAGARKDLQLMEAFTPVVDRVGALYSSLKFTVDAVRAELAAAGLQVYGISKQLARDPGASAGSVSIVSHVAVMKERLGRTGRPRKQKSQNPQPSTPTPQPPTPSIEA